MPMRRASEDHDRRLRRNRVHAAKPVRQAKEQRRPSPGGDTQRALRLLTINVHKGFSWLNKHFVLHELRDALRATSADIVFLQEVTGQNVKRARRHDNWPVAPHYAFLAESVWDQYAYGRNVVYNHGHHGNAVLSRYPIRSASRVDISTNRIERRGMLHCVIGPTTGAATVHCICVHLALFEASRRKQFGMLRDYIRSSVPQEAALVVAGDFNDWKAGSGARFGDLLGLTEVSVAIRGRPARTYPSWLPLLSLDRIYCRGFEVLSSHILHGGTWSALSDHAGLAADVAAAPCLEHAGVA